MIRHIVLFSFKKEVSPKEVLKADSLFKQLQEKIKEIVDFESGINISPENLNKGFSHAYSLSFSGVTSRDFYLEHPDHKSFSKSIGNLIDDVLVIDYEF